MKSLILLILFFPSIVWALDDATVNVIDYRASSAHSKADDIIHHHRL